MRAILFLLGLLTVASMAVAAERYTGPRPPKADVPYLVHADNLLETEVATATNAEEKGKTLAVVQGENSSAKTPLSEPIFIIKTEKLAADKFEAYHWQAKDGKRQVVIGAKKPKDVERPIYLKITRLDDKLYRIEVDEPLENGEYTLTPAGSDATFNFAIY
jgi:hypothetical protein